MSKLTLFCNKYPDFHLVNKRKNMILSHVTFFCCIILHVSLSFFIRVKKCVHLKEQNHLKKTSSQCRIQCKSINLLLFASFQPAARKRTSSSSSGLKFKNRTQSRQSLSRALSTSCSKQGRINNNRVPKRLKSQSKPSLSKVQLRSCRRAAEPKALSKSDACQLGLRDPKVVPYKNVAIKKEKDGREAAGQRGCVTRHAAQENGGLVHVPSADSSHCPIYRTRRSTRTLVKAQEAAVMVKLEPGAADPLSPAPGRTLIKTEPANMDEYLRPAVALHQQQQATMDIGYGRKGSCARRKRLPGGEQRTIKCEESYSEPFGSAPSFAASAADCGNVVLSFAERHRDYGGKALRRDKVKSGCRSQDKGKKKRRITQYDAQLILENSTGIPKLTLRRRRDSSSSKTNDGAGDPVGSSAVNSASSSKISIKFSKDHDKDNGSSYIAKLNNGFAPVVHSNATKLKIQLKREEDVRRSAPHREDMAAELEDRNGGHRGQNVLVEPSSEEDEEDEEEEDEEDEDDYFDNEFEDDFIPLPPAKRLRLIVGKDSIDIDISSRRREDQSLRLNA